MLNLTSFTSLEDHLTGNRIMSTQQKKLAGIWLDSTKAMIITQNEKEPDLIIFSTHSKQKKITVAVVNTP